MFGIGGMELFIILIIIMIIFGAGKLPEIGSGLGKAIRNFKSGISSGPVKEDDKKEKIEDINQS